MTSAFEANISSEVAEWGKRYQQECWKMYVEEKTTSEVVTSEYLSLVAKYLQGAEHKQYVEDYLYQNHGRMGHTRLLKFRHKVKKRRYICIPSPHGGSEMIVTLPEDPKNPNSAHLPVVPVEDFFKTLYSLHINTDHAMSATVTRLVRQQYKGIPRSAIELFLRGAICCNKFKPKARSSHTPENSLVSSLNSFVQVQLIDMTKKPSNGYNYIFQLHDVYSKFSWLLPLHTKDSQEVNTALRQLLGYQGPPQTLHIVDEEDCLEVHEIFKDWPNCHSVEIVRGWPNFLKYQGIVRKSEQLIEAFIMKGEMRWKRQGVPQPYPWDEYLPIIQYDMNTSYNKDVCTTPYEIVFGVPDMKSRILRKSSENIEKHNESQFASKDLSPTETESKIQSPVNQTVLEGASQGSNPTGRQLVSITTKGSEASSFSISHSTHTVTECSVGETNAQPSTKFAENSKTNVKHLNKPGSSDNSVQLISASARREINIVSSSGISVPVSEDHSAIPKIVTVQMKSGIKRREICSDQDNTQVKKIALVQNRAIGTGSQNLPKSCDSSPRQQSANTYTVSLYKPNTKTKTTIKDDQEGIQVKGQSEISAEMPQMSGNTDMLQEFEEGDFVSVVLPREYCKDPSRRLPGIVVQKVGTLHPSYVIRCAYGVLEVSVTARDLLPYQGKLLLSTEDWENAPMVSLRDAAEKLCVYMGTSYGLAHCHCTSLCRTNSCPCRKVRQSCVASCHTGPRRINCKNGFVPGSDHEDEEEDGTVRKEDLPDVVEVHVPEGMEQEYATQILQQGYMEDGVLYLPQGTADNLCVVE